MNIEQKKDYLLLLCENQLDTNSVVEFKKTLLEKLDFAKPIHFEASTVTKIDTVGIQFLLFICSQAEKKKITWHWENVSPTLTNIATLLGAHRLLKLPETKLSSESS